MLHIESTIVEHQNNAERPILTSSMYDPLRNTASRSRRLAEVRRFANLAFLFIFHWIFKVRFYFYTEIRLCYSQIDRIEKQTALVMTTAPDILAPYLVHCPTKPNAKESQEVYEKCLSDIESNFSQQLSFLRRQHEDVGFLIESNESVTTAN